MKLPWGKGSHGGVLRVPRGDRRGCPGGGGSMGTPEGGLGRGGGVSLTVKVARILLRLQVRHELSFLP